MPSDFGYINARVRGLKAKLVGDEFYNEVLAGSDFNAFLTSLSQSPYLSDLEEAQARYQGLRAVDEALGRNFYRTTRMILGFSDGNAGALIALFLLRYDLQNFKSIARAKHAGRAAEDIRKALLPAGTLKPSSLEAMAAAEDLPAAAQLLAIGRHPLSSAFSRAVSRYASDGDLYELELSLDRAFYQVVFEELAKHPHPEALARHFQREIDAANVRTALKVRNKEYSGEADSLFLKHGREIGRSLFANLCDDASDNALQALSQTSFAAVADSSTLSEAEAVIRELVDGSARRLYLLDPLDIGVVLHYLRLKENETAKLRLLARGKYYGVSRGQLEKELGHA